MAETDPPEDQPAPGEDEGEGTDESSSDDTPAEAEIEDPLKRDTVKYSKGERILGVVLDGGPKVGDRTIDVYLLARFLEQLDRVVRGLAAWTRGIPLETSGRIPRPRHAAPWRSRGVAFQHSATLEFDLGHPEVLTLSEEGFASSPTLDAVRQFGRLIELDAGPAVEELRGVDDRVGRDFSRLLGLLGDNELRSQWQPLDREPSTLPPDRADRVHAVLESETEPESLTVQVTGYLFQLNAKKNDFKLELEEEEITGSYDDGLVDELRSAWRHRVVAEVVAVERRYTYATDPHRVDYSLTRIVDRLEPID